MKITLRARHEVYHITELLFSFHTNKTVTNQMKPTIQIGRLYDEKTPKNFVKCLTFNGAHMCRKYLKCSSALSLRTHYVRDDRVFAYARGVCVCEQESKNPFESDRQKKSAIVFGIWHAMIQSLPLIMYWIFRCSFSLPAKFKIFRQQQQLLSTIVTVMLILTLCSCTQYIYLNLHTGSFTRHLCHVWCSLFNPLWVQCQESNRNWCIQIRKAQRRPPFDMNGLVPQPGLLFIGAFANIFI